MAVSYTHLMVLRCDDCIKYHLGKCYDLGTTTDEMYEVFAIANLVGGSIVVPHTRRAAEYWAVSYTHLIADQLGTADEAFESHDSNNLRCRQL